MARPSKYSPEFGEQAVELVEASNKTVAEVARDLGINDTTLGNRIRADQAEHGVPDASGLLPLTAAERAELTRLRREVSKLEMEREILEKSGGLLRDGVDEVTRFAFVEAEKAPFPVATLCRLLQVSRAGYYAWARRPLSARAVADEVLTVQIETIFAVNRKVYGAPRIHAELVEGGVRVGRKRVARLMRRAEIVGCHRRKGSFSITR